MSQINKKVTMRYKLKKQNIEINEDYKITIHEPTNREIEAIYENMRKNVEWKKHIDCRECGNKNCREMAIAIYNGINTKYNCTFYIQELIEEEKKQVKYISNYDQDLNIYNRKTMQELLEEYIAPEKIFSVVLADLNDFKSINATYGNEGGDKILLNIAVALKNLCEKNNWMCGRYSGDSFIITIPGKNEYYDSDDIMELQEAFTFPIPVGGEWVSTSVSIGISNSDGFTSAKNHLIAAEKAMYIAKEKGKNAIVEFTDEQKIKIKKENEIKKKIKNAIEYKEFYMVYQPQVDIHRNEVKGYEALIRMNDPELLPTQFIPIAEKNGWIWRIGRLATELVVKQLSKWREEGKTIKPVSINFSCNQLKDEGYAAFLENMLKRYEIPPEYIEIEITESLYLENTEIAQNLFNKFKEMGIRLLMDDFGTGYSSLGYLTYLPVDVIKLDKSLIDTYLVEGKEEFIKDIIKLMHDLHKEMLIEGVEEEWQYKKLCVFGADTIQGYYFSEPLVADKAIDYTL